MYDYLESLMGDENFLQVQQILKSDKIEDRRLCFWPFTSSLRPSIKLTTKAINVFVDVFLATICIKVLIINYFIRFYILVWSASEISWNFIEIGTSETDV